MSFVVAKRLGEPLSTLSAAHRQANYLSRKQTYRQNSQSERSERKREYARGGAPAAGACNRIVFSPVIYRKTALITQGGKKLIRYVFSMFKSIMKFFLNISPYSLFLQKSNPMRYSLSKELMA